MGSTYFWGQGSPARSIEQLPPSVVKGSLLALVTQRLSDGHHLRVFEPVGGLSTAGLGHGPNLGSVLVNRGDVRFEPLFEEANRASRRTLRLVGPRTIRPSHRLVSFRRVEKPWPIARDL